jgi:ComF family protein
MASWLNHHLLKTRVNLIIPVPLGRKRLRSRGYNQASLLAEGISEFCGHELHLFSLARVRETESQVGLDPIARLRNVQDAFSADKGSVEGKSILLVDDLVTTGATMSACARALFDAHASSVYGIAVARA